MSLFIQMCINLWVMLTNSIVVIQSFFLGIPYFRFAIIIITAIFVYKMSKHEFQLIKDPYIKASRRRI